MTGTRPRSRSRLRTGILGTALIAAATAGIALVPSWVSGAAQSPSTASGDTAGTVAAAGGGSGSADALIGRTPYLGWSSWSLQAMRDTSVNPQGDYSWLTEANVLAQAQAMASKLKSAGYTDINIDAGWWRKWDWTPEYDSNGRYAVDTDRFPSGLKATIDKIHALGLKVGIYVPVGLEKGAYDNGDFTVAGSRTCSTHDVVYDDLRTTNGWDSSYKLDFSKPCAQAWIDSETAQFASWGVDFLKIDGVGPGSGRNGTNYDDRDEIAAWNKGFTKVHHPVKIQLSWAQNVGYAADWSQLADSRRIEGDVECYCSTLTKWSAISSRFTDVLGWIPSAGKGKGWNNLDSLDVGVGSMDGLTDDERQTAATLWVIEAAPLYSGDDLTKLDDLGIELLTNREAIAIDQAGNPATPVSAGGFGPGGGGQVWWVRNSNGSYTVALFNLGSSTANVTAAWSNLGISKSVNLRDVWAQSDLGTSTGSYTASLPSHGSQLLTVWPSGVRH
jgi:hypothetical protein